MTLFLGFLLSLLLQYVCNVNGETTTTVNVCNIDTINSHWWLTAVYGPSKRENRGDFWMELEEIKSTCLPRWLMGGDFNIVRWQSETTAKNIAVPCMNSSILSFRDAISIIPQFQMPNTLGQTSRLDRFLYTPNWESIFEPHFSRLLLRETSDHFSITLESNSLKWGPSPFRFTNTFLKEVSFKQNFEHWWTNTAQAGHPGYSFMRRLKQLSQTIKSWSKSIKDSIVEERQALLKELEHIDNLKANNYHIYAHIQQNIHQN
ncbi:hypothetical protein Csa_020231 [Cucumis sativus]|nr:hypothetical protein Csa_020231 [Cucumis sativus]